MFERPTCVDCRRPAPQTNTAHTLLSASFGWRLSRVTALDGSRAIEWRCPACWRARKATAAKANVNRRGD
jgi:hypothetical protein